MGIIRDQLKKQQQDRIRAASVPAKQTESAGGATGTGGSLLSQTLKRATQPSGMSWGDYQKYENDYSTWTKTGKHSDDFSSWGTQKGFDAWKQIRDREKNGAQAALIGDRYYTLDKDTYDRYEKDYAAWKKTGKHTDDFDTWADSRQLDTWRKIRDYNIGVRAGKNPSMELQSTINGFDPEVLAQLQETYRSSWKYGTTDEDLARKAQGLPPKSKDKYYRSGTELDRWLYSQGLPSTQGDYFYTLYDAAAQEVAARRQQQASGQAAAAGPDYSGQARYDFTDQDEALGSIAGAFRSDWSYGSTTEDKARKRAGKMPKGVEALHTDSEIDKYYKEHGLPPASLISYYVDEWNAGLEGRRQEAQAAADRRAKMWEDIELEQLENEQRHRTGGKAPAKAAEPEAPEAAAEPEDLLTAAAGAEPATSSGPADHLPLEGKAAEETAAQEDPALRYVENAAARGVRREILERQGVPEDLLDAVYGTAEEPAVEPAAERDIIDAVTGAAPEAGAEPEEAAAEPDAQNGPGKWGDLIGERYVPGRAEREPAAEKIGTAKPGEGGPEKIGTAAPGEAETDLLAEAVGGSGRGVGPRVRRAQAGPVRALAPEEDDSAEQTELITFLTGMRDAGVSREEIEANDADGMIGSDLLDAVFGEEPAKPEPAPDPYAARPDGVDEYDWNSMVDYLKDHAGDGREAFDESGQWDDPVSQAALDAVFGPKSAEQVEFEREASQARQEAIDREKAERRARLTDGSAWAEEDAAITQANMEATWASEMGIDPSLYGTPEELAARNLDPNAPSTAPDFLYGADDIPAAQMTERIENIDRYLAKINEETPRTPWEVMHGLSEGEAGATIADLEAQRAKLVAMRASARAQEAVDASAQLYAELVRRPDWEENSAEIPYAEIRGFARNSDERNILKVFEGMGAYVEGRNAMEQEIDEYGPRVSGKYTNVYYMSEGERDVFRYLARTQGMDTAMEYVDRLLPALNARSYQEIADVAAYVSEHHPALAAVTTAWNATGGQLISAGEGAIAGIGGFLYDLSEGKIGQELVENDPRLKSTAFKAMSQANIRKRIVDESGSEMWGMVYDLGVSIFENGVRAALFGGAPNGQLLGAGTMYGQVFASTVYDYMTNKHADYKTAITAGFLHAGAEALGEAIDLGAFMKLKDEWKAGKATGKLIAQYIMKNVATEGGSEFITSVCEKAIDYLMLQDDSEIAQIYNEAFAKNQDAGEAWQAVLGATLKDAVIEGVSGAVSGLFLSGGNVVFNRMRYGKGAGSATMIAALTEGTDVDTDRAITVNMIERELREKGPNMNADERMAMMAEIRNMDGLTDAQKDHYMDVIESFGSLPQSMTSDGTKAAIADVESAAATASMTKAEIRAKAQSRGVKKAAQLQTAMDKVQAAATEMRETSDPKAKHEAAIRVQQETAAYESQYQQAAAEEEAARHEDELAIERAQAPVQKKLSDLERRADAEAGHLDEEVERRSAEERQADLDSRYAEYGARYAELEAAYKDAEARGDMDEAGRIAQEMKELSDAYAEQAGMPAAEQAGASMEQQGAEADERLGIEGDRAVIEREYRAERDALEVRLDEADMAGDVEAARAIEGEIRELDEQHAQLLEEMDAASEQQTGEINGTEGEDLGAGYAGEDRGGIGSEARAAEGSGDQEAGREAAGAAYEAGEQAEVAPQAPFTEQQAADIRRMAEDMAGRGRVIAEGSVTPAKAVAAGMRAALDTLSRWTGLGQTVVYDSADANAPAGFTLDGRTYARNGRDLVYNAAHENAHNMPAVIGGIRELLTSGKVSGDVFDAYMQARKQTGAVDVDYAGAQEEFAADAAGAVLSEAITGDAYYLDAMKKALGMTDDEYKALQDAVYEALAYDPETEMSEDDALAAAMGRERRPEGVRYSGNVAGKEEQGDLLAAAGIPVIDVKTDERRAEARTAADERLGVGSLAEEQGDLLSAAAGRDEEGGRMLEGADFTGAETSEEMKRSIARRERNKRAREQRKARQQKKAEEARLAQQQRMIEQGDLTPQQESEARDARMKRTRMTDEAAGAARELGDMIDALYGNLQETQTKKPNPAKVMTAVKNLLTGYENDLSGVTMDREEIADRLGEIIEAYRNAENRDAALETLMADTRALAEEILGSRELTLSEITGEEGAYEALMDHLAETPLKVGPKGREQLRRAFGDLRAFRKAVGDSLDVRFVDSDTESTYEDLGGTIGGYLDPEVAAQIEQAFGDTNTIDIVDLAEFVQAERHGEHDKKHPYRSLVSREEYDDHVDRIAYELARIAFDENKKISNLASYGDRGARAVGDVRKEIGRLAELAKAQQDRIAELAAAGNEEAESMRHWLTASKEAYRDTYKAGKGERAAIEQANAELWEKNARLNAENERLARSEYLSEVRHESDVRKRMDYEQRALDAEAERAKLEQEPALKRDRTRQEKLKKADELFKAGKSAVDYYNETRSNPKAYDHEVARQLNGMRLRNGEDVGGRINTPAFDTILERSEQYRPQKTLLTSLSSPVRVFENVAGKYSSKNSNAENARIYRDAQQLKDTYYEYGNAKMSDRTTYVAQERQKIEEAWTSHGKKDGFDSAAVQLLGEGICDESQIRNAVTDGKVMVVNGLDGTFVFRMYGHGKNKAAQLEAFCDSEKTYVYPTVGPFGRRSEKAVAIDGRLLVNRDGGIVRVTDATGKVWADIAAGKGRGLNTEAVTATEKALRDYYDQALEDQNLVLVENGYAPIRKIESRKYFPHIGRQETGLNGFLQFMRDQNLPTSINGLTSTFKPGHPWAAHMQKRLGVQTEYDAIRGFNKYVEAAGDEIYKTPVVQRLRQLENGLRKASLEEEGPSYPFRGGQRNSAFVDWLKEYANQFANKKADLDRGSEGVFGRFAYQLSQKATGLFSGASVGGNVSSSLSNLVSWFTGAAHMNPKYAVGSAWRQIVQGLSTGYDEEKGYDGFIRKVPYLNRAFGDAEAIRVFGESKAATLGGKLLYGLFGTVDRLAKESMGRAYYDGCMHKGMSEQEAIKRTDDFLIKNFADRGTGQAAKIFGIRTLKPIAQFQLEVLNQVYHFRDIDREAFENRLEKVMKEQGAKDATEIDWDSVSKKIYAGSRLPGLGAGGEELVKKMAYVLLLSLYGMFTRKWLGRDQSWNLFGMGLDIARGIREIPEGERTAEKVAGVVKDAAWDQAENNLPFLSTLNGGRVPVLGGVDTIKTGIRALTTERKKYEDSADVAVAAGKAALAFVPGGGQVSKTARGALALVRGGQYNAKGTQLQYPVKPTAGNWARGLLFGPSSMQPEGYDYETDVLSKNKTGAYRQLTAEQGMDPMEAYGILGSYTGSTNAQKSASLAAGAVQSGAKDPGEAFDAVAEAMGYKRGMKRNGQDLATFVEEDTEKRRADLQKKVDSGEITQEAADAEMDELERYLRIIRGY